MAGMVPVPSTSAGIAGADVVDFRHAPLRGLAGADGRSWEALDDDPQFLLTLPRAQDAGLYVIRARLHGAPVRSPSLFVDTGAGWSEETRIDLLPGRDPGEWSCLVELDGFAAEVRFDPADAPGRFHFAGVTLQLLDAAGALLHALDDAASGDPERAAALVHRARLVRDASGDMAVVDALRGDGSLSGRSAYARWIQRFDTLTPSQVDALRASADAMPRRPLLSLVVVLADEVGDPAMALLESLDDQIYPDWELCLVHAASDPSVLHALAARRSRLRLVDVAPSTSMVARANAGIDASTGEYAAVVNPAMRLAAHGLLALAVAAVRQPGARLLYADHDYLDAVGRRCEPVFKPAWDPCLASSRDYPGPLRLQARVPRTSSLTTPLDSQHVLHVPHVLYHVPLSETMAQPGLAAPLAGALDGTQIDGATTHGQPARAEEPEWVSIIIPTRDRVDLLRRCVDSILSLSTYPRFDIVVVDNGSVEPETLVYFASIERDVRVRILPYPHPFNYSAINNFAVANVDSGVVALLNNDIEVISPGWLEAMLQYALQPDVGAVGAMLYYPDDTIQHAGVIVGMGGVAGHAQAHQPRDGAGIDGRHARTMSAVTAACMMLRRDAYLAVGGLDESLAVAFNDIDFCLRLGQAGLRTVWTPHAELYHHESASRGSEDSPEKQSRFGGEVATMHARWGRALEADPYYNPNLSLVLGRENALADPPRVLLSDWVDTVVAAHPTHSGATGVTESVVPQQGP